MKLKLNLIKRGDLVNVEKPPVREHTEEKKTETTVTKIEEKKTETTVTKSEKKIPSNIEATVTKSEKKIFSNIETIIPRELSRDEKNKIKLNMKNIIFLLTGSENFTNLMLENEKEIFQTFTHKSINHTENYERYEFIGDVIMKLCFIENLFQMGGKDEGVLTPIIHHYLSTENQSKFLEKLGFQNLIIYDKKIFSLDMEMQEDVCEAIFGLLYEIGNKIVYKEKNIPNMGLEICKKLLSYLIDNTDIKIKTIDVKTNISKFKELVDKLGFKSADGKKYSYDKLIDKKSILNDNNITVHVYGYKPDNNYINLLNKKFPGSNNIHVSNSTSNTKKIAEEILCERLLKEYNNHNITEDILNKISINDLEEGLYEKVVDKLTNQNYEGFKIQDISKYDKNRISLSLLGIKNKDKINETKELLLTTVSSGSNDINSLKYLLLRNYIDSK